MIGLVLLGAGCSTNADNNDSIKQFNLSHSRTVDKIIDNNVICYIYTNWVGNSGNGGISCIEVSK